MGFSGLTKTVKISSSFSYIRNVLKRNKYMMKYLYDEIRAAYRKPDVFSPSAPENEKFKFFHGTKMAGTAVLFFVFFLNIQIYNLSIYIYRNNKNLFWFDFRFLRCISFIFLTLAQVILTSSIHSVYATLWK